MNNTDGIEKKFVETGRGRICYFKKTASLGAPTAIFLHGLSSNHTTWARAMDLFAEGGWTSIALDLRGHGFSDMSKKKSNYVWSVFAEDLKKIIDKENIREFHLAGYSFGGYIALTYAASRPEELKSMALVSTNYEFPFLSLWLRLLNAVVVSLCAFLAAALKWQGRKEYYYFEQGASRGYLDSTFKGLFSMPLTVNLWMLAETLRMNLAWTLDKIKIPVLVIRSKGDPFMPERQARAMLRKMPGAKLLELEHPTHFLGSRYEDELAKEVFVFFNSNL